MHGEQEKPVILKSVNSENAFLHYLHMLKTWIVFNILPKSLEGGVLNAVSAVKCLRRTTYYSTLQQRLVTEMSL